MCFFADENEVCLSAVVLEQVLERGSDGTFMRRADAVVFFEFGVVVFDGFVGGFDIRMWHCLWMLSESRIITDFTDDTDFLSKIRFGVSSSNRTGLSKKLPN